MAIILLILFSTYPWPMRPFGSAHGVSATLGDARGSVATPRFHRGMDIPADSGTKVYSIVTDDNVEVFPAGVNTYVRAGDYCYMHVYPTVVTGDSVLGILDTINTPPDTIGKVRRYTNGDHLHFQIGPQGGPYYNPLSYDDGPVGYDDNGTPVVSSIDFWRQGSEGDTAKQLVGVLDGRVDIRASCQDNQTSGGVNNTSGIYRLEWSVRNAETGESFGPFQTTIFPQVQPPNNGAPVLLVYDRHNYRTASPFYYWATNPIINHQVEDRYWNTKQKVGEPDSVDAQNKDEAKFPDGEYWVKVIAYDIRNNSDPESVRVRVDNFPPRVEWTHPPDGTTDVSIETQVRIGFDEPMDTTVDLRTAIAFSPGVSGNWIWATDTSAVFIPDPAFEPGHQYTIKATADLLHDLAERTLDGNEDGTSQGSPIDDYSWSFSTWMDYWLTEVPYNWDDAYWPVETWTNEIWCHFELVGYRFYGRYIYDHIPISGTGSIWWSDGCDISYHYDLPSANGHQYGVIAPYNDSIYVDSPWRIGNLYIEYKAGRRVIEWEFLRRYVSEFRDTTNFEVVLFNNGNIRFDYKRIEIFHNDGGSGISAGDTLRWISLTDAVGPVHTLEGRSFLFSVSVPPGAPVDLHIFEPERDSVGLGLAWSQNPEYDLSGYNVYRKESGAAQFERINEDLVTDTTYTDTVEQGVVYSYAVTALDTFLCESQFSNIVSWPPQFIRGDANVDMDVGMPDAMYILRYKFVPGSPPPTCMDAADADEDGAVEMPDAVYILNYKFVPGSPPPPSPFPDCGSDPTLDSLSCDWHPCMDKKPMISKAIPPKRTIGTLTLGKESVTGKKVTIPLYLTTNEPLSAFAFMVKYDPSFLTVVEVENRDLITQSFDFFSGRSDEEAGSLSIGGLVSFDFSRLLPSGSHKIADIIFALDSEKLSRNVELSVRGVELFNSNGEVMGARIVDEMVKAKLKDSIVFALKQNYPNPFRGCTVIRYQLPISAHTTLSIYNSAGQLIRKLVDKPEEPGFYTVIWDGKDSLGRQVSSGIYFYRLSADVHCSTKKLVVIE